MKVGYHYVLTRSGELQKGREEDETGAHAKGYNHKSIGVAMSGGVTQMTTLYLKIILLTLNGIHLKNYLQI